MDSKSIRKAFLDYFADRGHERVASGPIVPANDPTLMFTNAGMVQFKDVFTGKDARGYKRATTSQKCIRISGKHNDLENVGVTARHHTFFEMLGNFSFGDYFKRDAIAWAWEFLTEVMKIDQSKMVVTVFGGDDQVPADVDAEKLWAEISGLAPERIIRCGAKDNFWSMGDTGPCGPCSEIFYFIGDGDPDVSKFEEEPGIDGKGWTEIWNNVFMQFERHADGTMTPLPAPSVDTGMGLERLSVLKQGVTSNYDTDLLRPLVDLAAEISGKKYGGSLSPDDVSMRVIADHARSAAFLIAEGIFPDKGEREYVLRRVMRRAIRHGHRLGIDRPFLHEVAVKVADEMGDVYPELSERRAGIEEVTRAEEERFRRTLANGLSLLEDNDEWNDVGGKKQLPGAVAFKLYDTYGFPLDLQRVIGHEQGFAIDEAGYEAELEAARTRSQGSAVGEKALAQIFYDLHHDLGDTEFVGYEHESCGAKIVALVKDGARVESLAVGDEGQILVDKTPFYAESGGQVGDVGVIAHEHAHFAVADTQKPVGALFVHSGEVVEGKLEVGMEVELAVDHAARTRTRQNHSATHLLHYALRTVLGPQAMQKGSLVGPDRLRFDYAATQPLTADQIAEIEDLVNAKVWHNAPITTDVLPMDEAKARGAIGIFEEKYGSVVRMLTMTDDSIELCGGTHAHRTGDIGFFKLVSDSGLAAGVRRIEAATGARAVQAVRDIERELGLTAALVKANPAQAREKVAKLVAREKELLREIEGLKRKMMSGGGHDYKAGAKAVDGVNVLGVTVELGDPKALREFADKLRDELAPAVILVGTAGKKGKAFLACSVSKDVTDRFQAGAIVKDAAAVVGGGGGGRADFAQAGGSDPSKLGEAVERVYALTGAV